VRITEKDLIFDVPITDEEMKGVIISLKKKKACGDDRIPNDNMTWLPYVDQRIA